MSNTAVKRPLVLVVEDDFLIRLGAVEMIEAAGFDVVEAANADEAMEILKARLDITVVFTDVQMPGSMVSPTKNFRTKMSRLCIAENQLQTTRNVLLWLLWSGWRCRQ